MNLPSASRLGRAIACPASNVLPIVEEEKGEAAEKGTIVHRFLQRCNEVGREEAIEEVPGDWRAACEEIDTAALPTDPTAYAAEVALAYDPFTETARELGRGLSHEAARALRQPNEFVAIVDVLAIAPAWVYVGDYKTGRNQNATAERAQVALAALAAARLYKREAARTEILRVRKDSHWRDGDALNAIELDLFADRLRELARQISAWRATFAESKGLMLPKAVEGEHCSYCESWTYCPAKTAAIKAAVGLDLVNLRGEIEQLLPDQAAQAREKVDRYLKPLLALRDFIKGYARATPIPTRSGKVYTQVRNQQLRVVNADEVWKLLAERYGQEAADAACKLVTSWDVITKATEPYRADKKRGELTSLKKALTDAGGMALVDLRPKLAEVPAGDKRILLAGDVPLGLPEPEADEEEAA